MDPETQPDFVHEAGAGGPSGKTEAERRLPDPLPANLALTEQAPDRNTASARRSDVRAFVAAAAVAEVLWLSAIAYALLRLLT